MWLHIDIRSNLIDLRRLKVFLWCLVFWILFDHRKWLFHRAVVTRHFQRLRLSFHNWFQLLLFAFSDVFAILPLQLGPSCFLNILVYEVVLDVRDSVQLLENVLVLTHFWFIVPEIDALFIIDYLIFVGNLFLGSLVSYLLLQS